MQGTRSLVRELRSHMPRGGQKKKKTKLHALRSVSVNYGPSPFSFQALPTQRLVVQSTAPGGKGGQVSLTVHGTQQVHSPPEVGDGPFSHPPRPVPKGVRAPSSEVPVEPG